MGVAAIGAPDAELRLAGRLIGREVALRTEPACGTTTGVFRQLRLPNGSTLRNRVAKAAMEENLAGPGQLPDYRLRALYKLWAAGGAGLLITGNVMIDARAVTGPAGVVLEEGTPLEPFRRWAADAKRDDNQVWMQINHPGRQVYADLGGIAWSPSGIPAHGQVAANPFARPHAMDEDQIRQVIERFAATAARAEEAGFDGVQVHGAHGYLISQFLSPAANHRDDRWGGPIANRARILLDVLESVRRVTSEQFGISVKLNTADFQRGGFEADDALEVVRMLNGTRIDFLELSGGSAVAPVMHAGIDERTQGREAYFLDLATYLMPEALMPVMLTGGVRRRDTAEEVLNRGIALVGIGTALALNPDLPRRWQEGCDAQVNLPYVPSGDKATIAATKQAVVRYHLRHSVGADGGRGAEVSPEDALRLDRRRRSKHLLRYHNWLAEQATCSGCRASGGT